MIGSTRTRGLIARKSSAVPRGFLMEHSRLRAQIDCMGIAKQSIQSVCVSVLVVFVLFLVLGVRVQRIIRIEKKITQSERSMLAAEGPATTAGEILQVTGLLAQDTVEGLAPCSVAAHRMCGVLSHTLDREPQDVDAVPRREIELELVGLLQELDRQRQQFGREI